MCEYEFIREEFIEAESARVIRLATERPSQMILSQDYADRAARDIMGHQGGTDWTCEAHGLSNQPNCKACDCPAPSCWNRAFIAEAEQATAEWVRAWEEEHGSRFKDASVTPENLGDKIRASEVAKWERRWAFPID